MEALKKHDDGQHQRQHYLRFVSMDQRPILEQTCHVHDHCYGVHQGSFWDETHARMLRSCRSAVLKSHKGIHQQICQALQCLPCASVPIHCQSILPTFTRMSTGMIQTRTVEGPRGPVENIVARHETQVYIANLQWYQSLKSIVTSTGAAGASMRTPREAVGSQEIDGNLHPGNA